LNQQALSCHRWIKQPEDQVYHRPAGGVPSLPVERIWGVADNLCAEINSDFNIETVKYRQGQSSFHKLETASFMPLHNSLYYPRTPKKFFRLVDII
jgi:hypothetical protein